MQCKGCKYLHSSVVRTTYDDKKNIVNRRRSCLRCGLRFSTIEEFKDPIKKIERHAEMSK